MAKREFDTVESSFGEPWKPEKKGDSIEGIYTGMAKVKYEGRFFDSYRLKSEETGDVQAVAGGMLSSKFDQVPVGAYCKVTFVGMVKTGSGPAKDFEVQVAKGTVMKVPTGDVGGEDNTPF
jgi:hypothetical protein